MNRDGLVHSILQKASLEDCTLEELQSIARQYPYFAPAKLLLAEKLKASDLDSYNEELHKLSLHFTDPLWLDLLLNGYSTEPLSSPGPENLIESRPQQLVPGSEKIEMPEMVMDGSAAMQTTTHEEEQSMEDQTGMNAAGDVQPGSEEVQQPSEVNEAALPVSQERDNIDTGRPETGSESEHLMDESERQIPLPDLNQGPTETEITIQPYHTVDYFASQGIKFVAEEKPGDRFGQQLKSFTEWLKAMRRLPEAQVIKLSDEGFETRVQELADHSLNERDIVTETMAEVWLRQGNKEKAMEIYNKLSLLNPAKSAYFASLAEQLKNS